MARDSNIVLGNNIRRLRILARLSQTEMAHLLGLYLYHPTTPFQVSFHETGARRVSGTFLMAYAKVFKVPARFLYLRASTEEEFQQVIDDWYKENGMKKVVKWQPSDSIMAGD